MFLRRCEYVNEWFWLPSKRKTNFGKNDAGGTCLKSGIHIIKQKTPQKAVFFLYGEDEWILYNDSYNAINV